MSYVKWEFKEKPTPEEYGPLLEQVPAWSGSVSLNPPKTMRDYMEYVVPIQGSSGAWRLYTMVAGKVRMLQDAAAGKLVTENVSLEWRTGLLVVQGTLAVEEIGSVFEAATGVVGEGARAADRTNPVENAMTSWRGRAISALIGAGILPYSGMASAEEMIEADRRGELEKAGVRVISAQKKAPPAETKPGEETPAAEEPETKPNPFDKVVAQIKEKCGDLYIEAATDFLTQEGIAVPEDQIDATLANLGGAKLGAASRHMQKYVKDKQT